MSKIEAVKISVMEKVQKVEYVSKKHVDANTATVSDEVVHITYGNGAIAHKVEMTHSQFRVLLTSGCVYALKSNQNKEKPSDPDFVCFTKLAELEVRECYALVPTRGTLEIIKAAFPQEAV